SDAQAGSNPAQRFRHSKRHCPRVDSETVKHRRKPISVCRGRNPLVALPWLLSAFTIDYWYFVYQNRTSEGARYLPPPQRAQALPRWEVRMKVKQLLLEKGTRIISVRMNETVETAARMLRDENIGALVVKDVCNTEGDTVVGMFSERDFLRAIVDKGPAILKQPVSNLMTPRVISCTSRDDISYAVDLFNKHQI